jgi:hypothetical protein
MAQKGRKNQGRQEKYLGGVPPGQTVAKIAFKSGGKPAVHLSFASVLKAEDFGLKHT